MNSSIQYLITNASQLSAGLPVILAQAKWTSASDFKEGIGTIAGIIVMCGWLLALLAWYIGASQRDNNPAMSKQCFYMVWMFAIGAPVVSLVFYMMVGSSAVPTPKF